MAWLELRRLPWFPVASLDPVLEPSWGTVPDHPPMLFPCPHGILWWPNTSQHSPAVGLNVWSFWIFGQKRQASPVCECFPSLCCACWHPTDKDDTTESGPRGGGRGLKSTSWGIEAVPWCTGASTPRMAACSCGFCLPAVESTVFYLPKFLFFSGLNPEIPSPGRISLISKASLVALHWRL